MYNQYQTHGQAAQTAYGMNPYAQPNVAAALLPQAHSSSVLNQPYHHHQQQALLPQQQNAMHGLLPQGLAFGQHPLAQPSLLGAPPPRGLPIVQQGALGRALLNAVVANKAKYVAPRPIFKPRTPAPPMKPEEVLNRVGKLSSDFENPSRFVVTSNELVNLLTRGLSKDNASKFFEVLQKLSPLIGSPEYNSVTMSRIFDAANARAAMFSTEDAEAISKWKAELDAKKPKPSVPIFGKRPADATSDSNKRPRQDEANVESILLKRIDTLEEEVTKLRDELTKTRVRHAKELAQIRMHLSLPAPIDDEDMQDVAAVPSAASEVDVAAYLNADSAPAGEGADTSDNAPAAEEPAAGATTATTAATTTSTPSEEQEGAAASEGAATTDENNGPSIDLNA